MSIVPTSFIAQKSKFYTLELILSGQSYSRRYDRLTRFLTNARFVLIYGGQFRYGKVRYAGMV
jgi:hypothetical protein